MTYKRESLRRKRRLARNVRRILKGILLAPGKIPPIDLKTVETSMRACEAFGVLFVITLIARLSTVGTAAGQIIAVFNMINGIIFSSLLLFIKLADYQDRLVRMEMADYIYIR